MIGRDYSIPVYRLYGTFNAQSPYELDLREEQLDSRFLPPFAEPCTGEIRPGVHKGYRETSYDPLNITIGAVFSYPIFGPPTPLTCGARAIGLGILEDLFFCADCINLNDNIYFSTHLFYKHGIQAAGYPMYVDVPPYARSWGTGGIDGDGLVLVESARADDLFTGKHHGAAREALG